MCVHHRLYVTFIHRLPSVAALEVESTTLQDSHPVSGKLTVKLRELDTVENLVGKQRAGQFMKDVIRLMEPAFRLNIDGQPKLLANLSRIQRLRFDCLGERNDFEDAITNLHRAVQLAKDDHPSRPMWLYTLGNYQLTF